MAKLKKNAVNQILFTMVDKTDYATLETSLASNFTVKAFKTTHGSAAASVSTLSRLVSKVGSGFYRLSLEANACNCDFLGLRVAHASAATQMMIFEMATANDADLSDAISKIYAHTTGASDILSKVYLLDTSMASDVISMISTVSQLRTRMAWSTVSDMTSKIASRVWAASIDSASMVSNIASAVWAHAVGNSVAARVSKIQSIASDAHSAAAKSYSQVILAASELSDVHSLLTLVESLASDAHSAAAQASSRTLVNQSFLSDIDSALTSRFSDIHSFMSTTGVGLNASTMSDLRSAIDAGPGGALTTSNISDMASAVWKYGLASQTGAGTASSRLTATASRALVIRSLASDTYSLVSDVTSAIALVQTASDVASAVWAQK